MNLESIITTNHLSFSYSDTMVIQNITINIPRGSMVAIIGNSGCGKSTLLKLITGQLLPDSGNISVFQQDINSCSYVKRRSVLREFGVLFQNNALFTGMSVYDNVAFPLVENTRLPNSIIKKVVAMKLYAVGLFGAASLLPYQLSGGMARRVAIARAMSFDPKVMVYDEPFTGLDPITSKNILMLIKRLKDYLKQTVILVTHDMNMLDFVDYVCFLHDGKLLLSGNKDTVLNSNNDYLEQFFLPQNDAPPSHNSNYQNFLTQL